MGSDDNQETVIRNRAQVEQDLGLSEGRLVTVFQYHSAETTTVDTPWHYDDSPDADSMVTNRPGIGLGILTADCVPVLFADAGGKVVGAAHAGWKGAIGGVLESTVDAMVALGSHRNDIRACVGPCIRQESYEVGQELRDQFLSQETENERYFSTGDRPGHYLFDLAGYVLGRLNNCDIGSIEDVERDTYSEEASFYSYRRMTHRSESDYGRQISVIMREE